MNWRFNASGFFGLILLVLISSCDKDKPDIVPIAVVKVSPASGLTTDLFEFDASVSLPGRADDKPYYRWDWDNDGTWDGEYSRLPQVQHRFYVPGIHKTRMEIINSSGLIDTTILEINVKQGYSPPKADFAVSPSEGNFRTVFEFNASATYDDEDSLELLQFRWDFGDMGDWNIGFNKEFVASHVYQDTGLFVVKMEVKDPSNKIDSKDIDLHVSNINPSLLADFNWTPRYGTTVDTFLLDASLSRNQEDEGGIWGYSWRLPPIYEWTEWSTDPIVYQRLYREVTYPLELKIKDEYGLVNYRKKEIQIYHENLPPNPKFEIGTNQGNIKTQFLFDSWPTIDLESLPASLRVRWDFNGDGSYDTNYSHERVAYYQYPREGRYKITMEAIDPDGLSDTISHYIDVSPWGNETGLIRDHRDAQYYGTVKIGDQWWMAENLNFRPLDWRKDEVRKYCYQRYLNDPIKWCNTYGGLYNLYHATRNDIFGDVKGICPYHWHMPSKAEWEQMIAHIGGYNEAKKLLPGGETDFNVLMGGYGFLDYDPVEKTYVMDYKWRDYGTYFWSFTPIRGAIEPISSWNVTIFKDQDKIYPGYSGNTLYYSVRCVKDQE